MFISKVISYLDGWEILRSQKSEVYDDICSVLSQFNVENLSDPKIKPYGRNEGDRNPITPFSITHGMDYFLKQLGWSDYRVKPVEKGGIYLYARNLKDGISVRALAFR